jgi:hypothetical protein
MFAAKRHMDVLERSVKIKPEGRCSGKTPPQIHQA